MKLFALMALIIMSLTFSVEIIAQHIPSDTVTVQLFSFNDIDKRRGKYTLPDGEQRWEKIIMVRTLKCDSLTTQDKYACGEWDYSTNTVIYVPKGDTVELFEIGGFVTPYGKRLKLGGEKGWTWYYDITDYAPILKGEIDISSGNTQELLDLKIQFIKGTPERDVISVENIYPLGEYKYQHLADDSLLKQKDIILNKDAKQFMVRSRISGHGHFGPRNCCEWDSKTHSYYIGEWDHFRWNVWKDCGDNPIYPQGGTWPFDRAGWCPGTKVDEYDFNLTQYVNPGDTIKFDYAIEMYSGNGEKDGMYRQSHQLFTYGKINFKNNASIDDIIAPSSEDMYSRINPVCSSPRVVIKNSGSNTLQSLVITYGLKEGNKEVYTWKGKLEFQETEEVWLPTPNWKGLAKDQNFEVIVSKPNGTEDEYKLNNYKYSVVKLPLVLPDNFIVYIHTNDLGRAKENSYTITKESGEIMFHNAAFADDTEYNDEIALEEGCYQFRLVDKLEDGMLRHWWNWSTDKSKVGKNGKIEIHSMEGEVIHEFKYDFGQELVLWFFVGDLP